MPIDTYRSKGFTLLEVMVAVFVLAVGLLGLAQLQITAMKFNQSAEFRAQATLLASDILDRMRANQEGARNGNYAISIDDEPPSTTNLIADVDIQEWRESLIRYLPNGSGAINCSAFDPLLEFRCDITVTWTETQNDGDDYGALGQSSLTISGGI